MFFKKKNKEQVKEIQPQGKKVIFWGASDRMVCCEGIDCEVNEFNVTSNPKLNEIGYVCTLEISAPNESQGLLIHCFYSGHWSFAVSPSDEDSEELPAWHIERTWGKTNSHSETLEIYCPNNSRVEVINRIE
ncbi:hypothetical protein [Pseudoalteromonas sp. B530]|uniref:hypothetical protein n=1 Tax=Pseudoalteromonas sp. B530 TaxID=2994390 RepID=UPI00224B3BED|nr:hypothetical protein [Pseudoalteromonas sp. B530]MCX2767588.1 hypothetical protein [Pseudoalteromonas sp. B530]